VLRQSKPREASATAPATIEKMIDCARETVGIPLPAADLEGRGYSVKGRRPLCEDDWVHARASSVREGSGRLRRNQSHAKG
jgi:hypothetical protein